MIDGTTLTVAPVEGLPEIRKGDRLGELIAAAAAPPLNGGEVVVVSQKAVSKAEGRTRDLDEVVPGQRAVQMAEQLGKDPALVEVILSQTRVVVRAERGVLICETRDGWICANAGVDSSNVPGKRTVTLLPSNADDSARRVRREIKRACGAAPAVIVADSFGRPWRLGQVDIAIGCAGIEAMHSLRESIDRVGGRLEATEIAIADQLAAAADLVREKASGIPAVVIGGLDFLIMEHDGDGAKVLQRRAHEDIFRGSS